MKKFVATTATAVALAAFPATAMAVENTNTSTTTATTTIKGETYGVFHRPKTIEQARECFSQYEGETLKNIVFPVHKRCRYYTPANLALIFLISAPILYLHYFKGWGKKKEENKFF